MKEDKAEKAEKAECFGKMLDDWKGSNASFISFVDSHFNVFAIELIDPVSKKKFGIGLSRCSYISGPVSWSNANLSIIYDESNSLYILRDKKSNFFVKCASLLMKENLGKEYKLENFFKQ